MNHTPQRAQRALASILLLLGLSCVTIRGQSGPQSWSQFRGDDGTGVSSATNLPTDFSPGSGELAWKSPIRGHGHSSPIISNGRVFVTTAYPGTMASQTRTTKVVGMLALTVIALLAATASLRRRSAASGAGAQPATRWRLLFRLDTVIVGCASLAFLALALLATFRSEMFWEPGAPGNIWFYTGAIGLLGLTAATGWFKPWSSLRLAGCLVLVAVAAALAWKIPANQYADPFRLDFRAVMVAPAVAGVIWYLFAFWVARTRVRPTAALSSTWCPVALAAASVLLFVVYNFWQPAVGLVRAVICYDLKTGKELWDTPLFVAPEERKHTTNSFATPTPCADGKRVFAWFGSGHACLDFDGEILWHAVDEEYPKATRYGSGASPICYENRFIVLQDNEIKNRPSFLTAFDKETGAERMRVEYSDTQDSYSTPILIERGGAKELVTISSQWLLAFDPDTGKRLWTHGVPVSAIIPSLSYAGNDLLMVSGGTSPKLVTAGVRLRGTGSATKPETLWQTKRRVPTIASPIVYGGCLYTVTHGGILACYEPESGKLHYWQRLVGNYWASPVAGEDRLYCLSEAGKVTIVAPGPTFEIVKETELEPECFATPALCNGRILIRTTEHLYCFQHPSTR